MSAAGDPRVGVRRPVKLESCIRGEHLLHLTPRDVDEVRTLVDRHSPDSIGLSLVDVTGSIRMVERAIGVFRS